MEIPTDLREAVVSALQDKIQNDQRNESNKFSAFFKSLGKMFSGK